mgnify:CR=1 FL=1
MQTGARRATSATGAKTGKGKNGEVIVEKVMTSDSFLSREIKKAPLIEHDGSLVADISHIPNDLKITIQGAREHNLKNVDLAIPRNRMVVFTGLSGSGKSSLAFDTLFRRRPATLRRIPIRLRPPVPGSDGQARR